MKKSINTYDQAAKVMLANSGIYQSYINGNRSLVAKQIRSMTKLRLAMLLAKNSSDKQFVSFIIRVLNGGLYNV